MCKIMNLKCVAELAIKLFIGEIKFFNNVQNIGAFQEYFDGTFEFWSDNYGFVIFGFEQ